MNKYKNKDTYILLLLFILSCFVAVFLAWFFSPTLLEAQTWKGGNTADYDANSVCSDVYLLHRDGTTYPDETREECCPDTVITGGWGFIPVELGDTLIIGGDTIINNDSTIVYIPIIIDNDVDTVFFGAETLVVLDIDSVYVFGGNDRTYFTTFNTFVCETLSLGIDTVTADTFNCIFCDSVLNVAWWTIEGEDTIQFDYWQLTYPSPLDSCDLIQLTEINISGDYIDNTVNIDTIIYRIDGSDSTLIETIVENRIEEIFDNNRVGVWVKECECTITVADILPSDSVDAMFCI